jgi:hypothetical protein
MVPAGFFVDRGFLSLLFLMCVMHRLDDGQGEEQRNKQKLDSHLEEGKVYIGVEAGRCQHLFVGDVP